MRRPFPNGPLALAALGVVFGDIGTSPLYTLTTCYTTANAAPNLENTLGIISAIAWALIVVVCIKYVTFLMRVDHEGEGGILALLAIASPPNLIGKLHGMKWLIVTVVIGAAMLIGDGMITPAISVISAVEGIGEVTTAAQPWIVPVSLGVLLFLFLIQYRGTQSVGVLFGPVMLLWFIAIGIVGAVAIVAHPAILAAINPYHALYFITHHGIYGFLIFGAVILALTGAEALYADLSHFGRIPITIAWYGVVFPALLLNYFGQGANLIANPKAVDSPFYALTTGWALIPMVVLATAATVIASQALISGAFTLVEQAIAMNLAPRMQIIHTSQDQRGQVYVPFVNFLLAIVCLILVVTFKSSARLAAAYGLAVACTMLATTITYFVVATRVFKWPRRYVIPGISLFVVIDALFVLSGLPKFADGAWVPIAISVLMAFISLTWLKGRRRLAFALAGDHQPVTQFAAQRDETFKPVSRTVLLTRDTHGIPFVRQHRWMPGYLHDKSVVLLTLAPAGRPYVEQARRVQIERLGHALYAVKASFGYMEQPNFRAIVRACARFDFTIDDDTTTYFFAAPELRGGGDSGMLRWQRVVFMWLVRVSRSLIDDLELPVDRRVGLGIEIQL
jgi:KUP system potassium uptake protein